MVSFHTSLDSYLAPNILARYPQVEMFRMWDWNMEQAVDLLAKNGLIYLTDWHMISLWKQFTTHPRAPREATVLVDGIPDDWPRPPGWRVIRVNGWAYKFGLLARQLGTPCLYHRNPAAMDRTFMIQCGSHDQGRAQFINLLRQMDLLEGAAWSTVEIGQDQYVFDPDPAEANSVMAAPQTSHTWDEVSFDRRKKFEHDENARDSIDMHRRCHFAVAMANHALADTCGSFTEKQFWATLSGVPVIWLGSEYQRQQLLGWGFREAMPVPGHTPGATRWETAWRWACEIAGMHRLIQNPEWAQRWHDRQSQGRVDNHRATMALCDTIVEDIQSQLERSC